MRNQPPTEVKLGLACGVILRYDGKSFNYCWWDGPNNRFQPIGASAIQVNAKYSYVTLCISPNEIFVFENYNLIGVWNTNIFSPFQPRFDWQILSAKSALNATLTDMKVAAAGFPVDQISQFDLPFSNKITNSPFPGKPVTLDQFWVWPTPANAAIPISLSDGYMRISTSSLAVQNSIVSTQPLKVLMMPPWGILMYRMRVNQFDGYESKVTIFGDIILRITNNGQSIESDEFKDDWFSKLGDTTIRVGATDFTTVMLVYSLTSVVLFENGVKMFSHNWGKPPSQVAKFDVQHYDVNTAVPVDLSHVRCVTQAWYFVQQSSNHAF